MLGKDYVVCKKCGLMRSTQLEMQGAYESGWGCDCPALPNLTREVWRRQAMRFAEAALRGLFANPESYPVVPRDTEDLKKLANDMTIEMLGWCPEEEPTDERIKEDAVNKS